MTQELSHYGIKGMKWGVRRYQKENGKLTTAGKKRYKPSQTDITIYGEKGAERIAKDRNKGYDRKTAVRREFARKAVSAAAFVSVGALMATRPDLIVKGVNSAANLGKSIHDKYYNAELLGPDGSVIKKYHSAVKVGEFITQDLVRR